MVTYILSCLLIQVHEMIKVLSKLAIILLVILILHHLWDATYVLVFRDECKPILLLALQLGRFKNMLKNGIKYFSSLHHEAVFIISLIDFGCRIIVYDLDYFRLSLCFRFVCVVLLRVDNLRSLPIVIKFKIWEYLIRDFKILVILNFLFINDILWRLLVMGDSLINLSIEVRIVIKSSRRSLSWF